MRQKKRKALIMARKIKAAFVAEYEPRDRKRVKTKARDMARQAKNKIRQAEQGK